MQPGSASDVTRIPVAAGCHAVGGLDGPYIGRHHRVRRGGIRTADPIHRRHPRTNFRNAAEHFAAITVAKKDKMDLSVGIAIGSSIQIALFVAPLMILLGWALAVPLTLQFGMFETLATFLAVLVTNFIIQDGESNWLEGAMLLVTYAIIALAFLFL